MIPIKIKNIHQYANVHSQSILDYYTVRKRVRQFVAINNWIRNTFGAKVSLKDLLEANPISMEKLVLKFSRVPNRSIPASVKNLKVVYDKFATASKSPFRLPNGDRYTAYSLVGSLGITVCPYCNRNYIFNIPTTQRRTSQLDHFYDKDNYPFLALSFYNLIPVCSICNHIKSNQQGRYYNPYNNRRTSDELITFSFNVKGARYLDEIDDLEIKLSPHKLLSDNVRYLKLNEIYSHHRDLIQEIAKKGKIYDKNYIDVLFKKYQGSLFKSREELLNLILGNYITEDELGKRPFAKMTRDIWKQIKP